MSNFKLFTTCTLNDNSPTFAPFRMQLLIVILCLIKCTKLTLFLIVFPGFYIAWTPYFVTVAIPEMIIGRSLHPITDFIGPWLGASNSFWNPFIYIPTMKPFYLAMVALFPCRKHKTCNCGKKVLWSQKCDCGGGTAMSSSNSAGTNSTGLSRSGALANGR